ncbi:MAG: AGE family epimerase/isomerase [Clostridia bacterium]|nr:AGE family epimerase/isomerase [Clostridia bacterium]
MNKEQLVQTKAWISSELEKSISFWLEKGMDKEHGGIYTCLDREGKVYSTDKSVWMQGRCAWMFAWLCGIYGKKEEWVAASKSCIDFMDTYCFDSPEKKRMYYTVACNGTPLTQKNDSFSESFYAIANAEFYGITGEKKYLDNALRAYNTYLEAYRGKIFAGARKMRALGNPMICLNITNVLKRVDKENFSFYNTVAKECIEDIFTNHYHPELKCVLENVGENGEAFLDVSEGRVVNPGHVIEAVWFVLEHAKADQDETLVEKAEQIFNWSYEIGWDKEFGGMLTFVDALGNPTEFYEHDVKKWWPQNELIIASLMLYRDTGKEKYLDCFFKAVAFCREHFTDKEYGEWYGVLRRDGKVSQPAFKGSTVKGPFHLPRMLAMTDMMLNDLI